MTTGLDLTEELGVEVTKFTGDQTGLGQGLLDFFETCKYALSLTHDGTPECAYINEGPPAWDSCPCLICWSGAPEIGDTYPLQPTLAPSHRVALARSVNLVTYTAVALRCQATTNERGDLPTPAQHEAVTLQINEDMWALWNVLREAHYQEILFPPRDRREFSLQPGIAYNPMGEAAGSAITVRVQMDGYVPDLSGLVLPS